MVHINSYLLSNAKKTLKGQKMIEICKSMNEISVDDFKAWIMTTHL